MNLDTGRRTDPEQLAATLGTLLNPEQLRTGVVLAPYTTFRIGGPADVMYDATTAEELASAVTAAKELGIPWFVLGSGANILVGDRGFRGLVVRNVADRFALSPAGLLTAESGASMQELVLTSVRSGWSGLEHFIGIPSTVGGALWQNLHFLSPAPERERTVFIEEVFRSAEILTEEGERREVEADYIRFGYDDSVFQHRRDVVLSATFSLKASDSARLHRVLQENLSWRGARHPWLSVHPSAGSVFRKIEGAGAGRLIDSAGLKGFRVGNAQVSHVHANIFVNLGGATASDVRSLIEHVQRAVEERHGYRLVPEIGFIGEF